MRAWRRLGRILLAYCLSLYIVLVGALFVFQRDLLFFRINRVAVTPAEAQVPDMKAVQVTTSDGLVLHNWFAPSRNAALPVVIIFFGQADSLWTHASTARWLMGQGFGVLLANYRGYSGDEGAPTEENVYKDARASVEFVRSQGYSFSLMGISLGTGIAVQMATEYPARSLVLLSPYSSIREVAAGRFPIVPVRWLMQDSFDSLEKMARVEEPLFVVMGRQDEIIPFSQAEALFKAARQPKVNVWIDDARHVNYRDSQYRPQLLEFLLKY